jgi:hypothetical protein
VIQSPDSELPTLILTERDFSRNPAGGISYRGTPFNAYDGNVVIDAKLSSRDEYIRWDSRHSSNGSALAIKGSLTVKNGTKLRFCGDLMVCGTIEAPDSEFQVDGTLFALKKVVKIRKILANYIHAEGRVYGHEINVINDAVAGSFDIAEDVVAQRGNIHATSLISGSLFAGGRIVAGGNIVVNNKTQSGRDIVASKQIDSNNISAALSIQSEMFIRAVHISAGLTIEAGVGAIERFVESSNLAEDFDPLLNWPGEQGLRVDAIIGQIKAGTVVRGTQMVLKEGRYEVMEPITEETTESEQQVTAQRRRPR